jgi:hypothetical protein
MKTYGSVWVQLHGFLTLVLDSGERFASHLGHFIPWEKDPGTHLMGGRAGPRISLDMVVNWSCQDEETE